MESAIPHLEKITADLDSLMKAARDGDVKLEGPALAGVAMAGIKLKSAYRTAKEMEQYFQDVEDRTPACERGLPAGDN